MLIVNQNNKDIILWILNVTHTGGRAYADQTELIFLVGQTSCVPLDMPQAISTAEFQRTSLLKRCDTSLKKKKRSEKFQRIWFVLHDMLCHRNRSILQIYSLSLAYLAQGSTKENTSETGELMGYQSG